MTALTGRPMTPDDRVYIEQFPVECHEHVAKRKRGEVVWEGPCDEIAIGAKFDPNEGSAYAVCAKHAKGEMVTLADLLCQWDHLGGVDITRAGRVARIAAKADRIERTACHGAPCVCVSGDTEGAEVTG